MPCCIHALEMNCCADDHDDIDALFNDETDVQFLESLCSKRLHESKGEFGMLVSDAQNDASDIWGYLSEIGHEKEVLHMSTHSPRLLIHFYNPSFKSCQLLNEHLQVGTFLNAMQLLILSFLIYRSWLESFLLPVSFLLKLQRLPF